MRIEHLVDHGFKRKSFKDKQWLSSYWRVNECVDNDLALLINPLMRFYSGLVALVLSRKTVLAHLYVRYDMYMNKKDMLINEYCEMDFATFEQP